MDTRKEKKYLAIDLGADSGRGMVGVFDGSRVTLKEIKRFPTHHITVAGHTFWDVLAIFREIKDIIRTAVREEQDIQGIGVTTWGVDYALLTRNDTLIGNPFHYRDGRTDGIMEEVFATVSQEEIFKATGIQFMELNTLFQLYATKKEFPELFTSAETLLFMPDLFNFWLTGKKYAEFTVASTSQLYDMTATGQEQAPRGNWAFPLLERLGIPGRILPPVIAPGTLLGPLSESLRCELDVPEIPVYAVCCHDTASAVAAVPAGEGNWAYLSCGTWSLLGVELLEPVIDEKSLRHHFTNEGGFAGSIRFLTNIMGLWVMQESRRTWQRQGKEYTYEQINRMASERDPFQSFINLADKVFLYPGDMPERIREFCRKTCQKVPQEEGQTARIILESLAMEYRFMIDNLEETTGEKIETIHLVGGGSQNKFLAQCAASATRKVVIAGPVEATAIGNILIQALAKGDVLDIPQVRQIVRNSFPLIVYQPAGTSVWEEKYYVYKQLKKMGG